MIKIKNGCWVDASSVCEVEVSGHGESVVVHVKGGDVHWVTPDDGGAYELADRLARDINNATAGSEVDV